MGADNIYAITTDAAGNVVVTGNTKSNDLMWNLTKRVTNADGTIKTPQSEKLKNQHSEWTLAGVVER